jgi:hypothetical protein
LSAEASKKENQLQKHTQNPNLDTQKKMKSRLTVRMDAGTASTVNGIYATALHAFQNLTSVRYDPGM